MVVLRSMILVKTPPRVFNAQRKRRNIEEQDVLDIADEDTGLDSCADSDTFIGV